MSANSFGLMAAVSNGRAAEKGSFRFPQQQQPRHPPLCQQRQQQQQQRGASRGAGALLMAADGEKKEAKPPREVILLLYCCFRPTTAFFVQSAAANPRYARQHVVRVRGGFSHLGGGCAKEICTPTYLRYASGETCGLDILLLYPRNRKA